MVCLNLIVALLWVPLTSGVVSFKRENDAPLWVARILTRFEITSQPQGDQVYISTVCDGSLIAPHWVLSAKQCALKDDGKVLSDPLYVSVGHENFLYGDKLIVIDVAWNKKMAMLKLERDVTNITPVIVQLDNNIDFVGRYATIYHWIQTGQAVVGPNVLKDTRVKLRDNCICNENFACLDPNVPDASACLGDSGGPMVITLNTVPVLIAISHVVGPFSCSLGQKSFYISTLCYATWIAEKMRE